MLRRIVMMCVITAITVGTFAAPSSPAAETMKVLLHPRKRNAHIDPEVLKAINARVLATYGEGHAVAFPAQTRDEFMERFAAFDVRELDDVISTPRHIIDPRIDAPPPLPAGAGLFLLQYVAPATPAWQAALRASGVIEVQSLPERDSARLRPRVALLRTPHDTTHTLARGP